jgi:drug/metabolite transporter (DMT)-like permease
MRIIAYTTLALVAFAANSVLCRIALGSATIDAATFSTIRLIAGAATLLVAMAWTQRGALQLKGSWTSAGMLFLYAVPFSFAYLSLSTGTGALILFGSVQVTMMSAALWSGERPHSLQWLGLGLALAGLVYLVLPGLTAPPLRGAALMALAGFAWGVYSLRGRGAANPLADTTSSFVRSVPLVLAVSLIALPRFHAEPAGVLLAVASGALASGLGYVVWYEALRDLTATRAAVVQLSVPILAAAGGVIFLSESISMRLVISALIVLGGVSLALVGRERLAQSADPSAAC